MHTSTGPLPTPLSIAVEDDQGEEATSIIDMQDSLHHCHSTTGKQAGQMHTLILTELDLLLNMGIVTRIDAIHIPLLEINNPITQLVILIIIIVTCHTMQIICTP